MMAKKRKPISQEEQSRRFIEAAKEMGVDDEAAHALVRIVREIAKQSPKPKKAPRKK